MTLPKGPFVGERLRLVPLNESHEPGLWEMFSDAESIRYVPFELATDREKSKSDVLALIAAGERFKFHLGIEWIRPALDRGAIGLGMLRPTEDGKALEVGYWIVRRHWGKGLATEAARIIIDQIAPAVGAREKDLIAKIGDGNAGSFVVAEKLGFQKVSSEDENGRALWTLRYRP